MSNLNTKFQASLIQIDWELWIRTSTVKWEFTSRLVIGTHGVCTVTWKTIHGWNSRVPWKPTVKRQKRRHSNYTFLDDFSKQLEKSLLSAYYKVHHRYIILKINIIWFWIFVRSPTWWKIRVFMAITSSFIEKDNTIYKKRYLIFYST